MRLMLREGTVSTKPQSAAAGTFLLLVFLELFVSSAVSAQLTDLRGDPVNEFPINKNAEGFRTEKTLVSISFKIYFPVGENRYIAVNQGLAKQISTAPTVKAPQHMQVQVTKTVCTPRDLNLKDGSSITKVKGGIVECDVELLPEPSLEPGSHEITLEFVRLTEVYREVDAKGQSPAAEARINISVWPSREAKRDAEQKPERERREQEEARAREAAAFRLELLKIAGIALIVSLVPSLVALRYRKWIWPLLTVNVAPGQHLQIPRAVKALRGEEFSEPGTILRTLWAKDWHGKTERIKVETFVAGDGDEGKVAQGQRTVAKSHHEFGKGGNPSMPALENLRLDILVSVGTSVPAGTYLAECPNGSMKIKVLKRRF